ncbi:MAG: diadenylate cyclase CdaA [Ruminococcus sp.]|nr:diadenylate cyclase CdaA [Ruminococcus sp.]
MSSFRDILDMIYSVIKTAEFVDILDIIVLSYVVYIAIKLVRETRAGQLLKGILLIILVYMIASAIDMKAITYLLSATLNIGLIALIILFQPELRRMLEKAGYTTWGLWFGGGSSADDATWMKAIDAICDACVELSATSTGALIVVERQSRLGEQIANGTILDAIPSKELFGNIFYNKTPLHDGAAIIRDGKILAAACFLPKPQKEELINKRLGSRHRAAIGMSENSDAIVIVVSEETGAISVAENGVLRSGFTREQLHQLLTEKLIRAEEETTMKKVKRFAGKIPFIAKNTRKNTKRKEIRHGSETKQSENETTEGQSTQTDQFTDSKDV